MKYDLPEGVGSAQLLDFPNPIQIQSVRLINPYLIQARNQPPALGYHVSQWGGGASGNMNARWRKHQGTDHEARNKQRNKRWKGQ